MQNKGHGKERRGKDRYMKINKKNQGKRESIETTQNTYENKQRERQKKSRREKNNRKRKNNSTMKERRKRKRQKVQDTDLQETE